MRRFLRSVGVVLAGILAAPEHVRAGDWVIVPDGPAYVRELWGGGEATGHSITVYTGMTYALTGGDIRFDGFRLRSGGSVGSYAYTSPRWNGSKRVPVAFEGEQSTSELLLGYQKRIGPWIIKAFAGGTMDRHNIRPFDDENSVQGAKLGLKGAFDAWTNIGATGFLHADASWSEPYKAYSARLRGGYRLSPNLSAGPEAGATGNSAYDAVRVGAFGRFHWERGEVSVSGGGAGDRAGTTGAYGSLGLLYRY